MAAEDAALREAMERSLKNPALDMAPGEVEKFTKAFEEPEFRSLMQEYMQEISDPKHRAEQEEYIRTLERDNKVPTGKMLIHPQVGFVAKCLRKASGNENEPEGNEAAGAAEPEAQRKLWINVVGHDEIAEPESSRGESGEHWSLPYSLGPARVELDKKGTTVPTRDICFHPAAVERAKASQRFRDLLVSTALDAWEANPPSGGAAEPLERTYHVLRGVAYKTGTPATMVLSKPAAPQPEAAPAASTSATPTKEASKGASTASTEAPPLRSPAAPPAKASDTKLKAGFLKSSAPKAPKAPLEPHYTIVYRGTFDIGDHLQATGGAPTVASRPRPRHLVIRIELPRLESVGTMELDVSPLELQFQVPDTYNLHLPLPYPVVDADGTAAFDKARRVLTVTLPVQPAEASEAALPRRATSPSHGATASPPASPKEAAIAARATPAAKPKGPAHDRWLERPASENKLAAELGITPLAALPTSLPQDTRTTSPPAAPPAAPSSATQASGCSIKAAGALLEPPAADENFVSAKAFAGRMAGFVFKCGDDGVGYYRDTAPAPHKTPSRQTASGNSAGPLGKAADVGAVPKWDVRQNETCVTLLLQMKGVTNVNLEVEGQSVLLDLGEESGASTRLAVECGGVVDPESCRWDAADRNVVVVIGKAEAGDVWDGPVAVVARVPAPAPAPLQAPSQPEFRNRVLFELD